MKEIDLSKSQIIDGDVKVKVWNDSEDKPIYIRYLQCIDHSLVRPFICFDGGETRENTGMLCSWEYAELIESPPKPKTRLMTRREILAKVATMDKDNPFLVGEFISKEEAEGSDFLEWKTCQYWGYDHTDERNYYYRHIHPKTGEWTSEPMQFLIEEMEGEK